MGEDNFECHEERNEANKYVKKKTLFLCQWILLLALL